MLFNSFSFLVFFTLVTALFFVLPHRVRWLLLLTASCTFYMFFVPIYILILIATIVVDYYAAIWIEDSSSPKIKKRWLQVSIVSVCAILFVFKYFNFFNQNIASVASFLHWNYPISALQIILPIGLSFHTFQSLSYVIEVYRGHQRAERHFGIYALYVMYYPQLVAGPIERPQNLLDQFKTEHTFDWARFRDGLYLCLWGLFKKVVVADSVAVYVDAVYNNYHDHSGPTLWIATYFFAVQIYCDFSGYSDMARGISRIYGIELMKNFETPYFATSISEFWSRWHISLSTWFRDYVYIPLGGNRVGMAKHLRNLMVVFLLSGIWHGANWTFIIWGGLHGLYLIVERLWKNLDEDSLLRLTQKAFPRLWNVLCWALVFHVVLLSWVFFRADHVHTAFAILAKMSHFRGPVFWDLVSTQGALVIAMLIFLDAAFRWVDYWNTPRRLQPVLRLAISLVLLFAILLFGVDSGTQFIYFQF